MKPIYLLFFVLTTGLTSLRAGISVKNLLEATNASSCDGGFTLEASGTAGPFNVTLTGPSNQNLTGINGDRVFTNLCSGTYNIHVYNAFGCDVNLTATVLEGRMTVSINGGRVTCGEAANLVTTVVGGLAPFTYAWSNGTTTANLSTMVTSTYGVTVTDNRGMTASASYTMLSAIPKPTLTFTNFNQFTSCTYSNSGNPELTTSTSGTANINFTTTKDPSQTLDIKIKNLTTGANVTKGNSIYYQFLKPGNHEFTLSVVGGPAACTTVYPFRLGCCQEIRYGSVITPGIGVNPVIQSPTTATSNNGSINLNLGSGYVLNWAHGPTTSQITGLGVGQYCAYINNGCGTTEQFCYNLVNCASTPVTIASTLITPTCTGLPGGAININLSPSISAKYLWSNGATTKNIANLVPGQYCVTATNTATGCSYSNCFTVNTTGNGTVQTNSYNVVDCTERYTCNGQTVTKKGTASYTVNTNCQFTYSCSLKPTQTTVKNGVRTTRNGVYQYGDCFGPEGCFDGYSGIFFFQSTAPYYHSNVYFSPTYNNTGYQDNCASGECKYTMYCGNTYIGDAYCGTCDNYLAPGEAYTLDAEKTTIAETLWAYHKAGYFADTTLIALPVGITPFTLEKDYRIFLESTAGKDLPAILWRAPWEMIGKPRPEALKVSKLPTRIDESGTPLAEAWPNPFNDVLNFRFADKVQDEQQFYFMDVLGRVVWEGTLPKMDNKGEVSLNIPESIASGVYFVKLNSAEKAGFSFKLNRIKN
ncbi:MAG TPA: T9SS type A sorting domain-containing protein [Haliscomenobacter sp.]|uniref:T9SS type A sorting domain-containing protein n=1 Tax=Haliscomenobacter sp. TaxID=2717303 RepID=UPI002CAA77B5|nr:T9SS type A sorting domain-containing protein [Haliscomenobacter sp.]HOY18976.1 T9SS type A sorting domain-containing protein [Haliscomenobacter sp.]